MTSPLAARLSRFLVGCYPRRWRQRYAEELLEVLDQHRPTARTVLNLWAGAVSAHLDPAWRAGRHPTIRLRRWARSRLPASLPSCWCSHWASASWPGRMERAIRGRRCR